MASLLSHERDPLRQVSKMLRRERLSINVVRASRNRPVRPPPRPPDAEEDDEAATRERLINDLFDAIEEGDEG